MNSSLHHEKNPMEILLILFYQFSFEIKSLGANSQSQKPNLVYDVILFLKKSDSKVCFVNNEV